MCGRRCVRSSFSHVRRIEGCTIRSVGPNADELLANCGLSVAIREITLNDFPRPMASARMPPRTSPG